MPILASNRITKSFEQGGEIIHALHEATFSVNAGEIVAIVGPSGSGKTTLLSIIGCILTPSAGELTIDGTSISAQPKHLANIRRRYIGFIFQQSNLFSALTVHENVTYALLAKGFTPKRANILAAEAIESVGLKDRMDFLPNQLSGGQKQRVAIARAFSSSPQILLADEPTASLDWQSAEPITLSMMSLAKKRNSAIIIVTHDHRIQSMCDRSLAISEGRLYDL